MGQSEKSIEQAEFVENLKGGGVDGIAAEIAEEVFMLFKNGDLDACAREQIAEHDSGRAAADDAAVGLGDRNCHGGARVAMGWCGVKG